ncbi:MAG TPA: type IX secretion system outer membrane channel protein PorV [Puia sp.]|nr:type IX secretion system outer membrane channel protein PorV [Puia sp.]
MINKLLRDIVIGVFVLMLQQEGLLAQSSAPVNVVTSSVPFLQISPDSRSGGMGDVGVAVSPDANAIFRNQAKTAFADSKFAIGANYIPWLKDVADGVSMTSLAGYYKLGKNEAVSGGLRYFNMGNINFTNDGTTILGSQRPREYSIEGGYARKLDEHFGLGLTFRYINSSLIQGSVGGKEYKTGTAFAADLSLFYQHKDSKGQGAAAGLTISNLGSRIGYTNDNTNKSFLPANLCMGGAYTWVVEEDNKLTLAVDVNHLLVPAYDSTNGGADYYHRSVLSGMGKSFGNKDFQAAAGMEYNYRNQFFARAGYHWETKEAGDLKFFSAGLGLKVSEWGFDFSYLAPSGQGVNRNPLSNTLRFSVLFEL